MCDDQHYLLGIGIIGSLAPARPSSAQSRLHSGMLVALGLAASCGSRPTTSILRETGWRSSQCGSHRSCRRLKLNSIKQKPMVGVDLNVPLGLTLRPAYLRTSPNMRVVERQGEIPAQQDCTLNLLDHLRG